MAGTPSTLIWAHRGPQEEKELDEDVGICGCSRRSQATFIGLLELVISTTSVIYTMIDIYYFPASLPDIFIHDELYAEAKKHAQEKNATIPKGLLYWDLFLFSIEFVLAITLLYGIAERKLSRIRYWMTSMVTYNVIMTGIFFGFIIGGISSTRLNFVGFIHAFFRFVEIAIVYGYYEELSRIKKEERLLRDNNNTIRPDNHRDDYGMHRDVLQQVAVLVQYSGLIIAASAFQLLITSSNFHVSLKSSRSLTRNYTTVLKRYKDAQGQSYRNVFDVQEASCNKHFLDHWYLVLAFFTILLSIYQFIIAIWGSCAAWVKREKDIILSLWISRTWEPSLYLLGIFYLILHGTVSYSREQSEWLEGFFSEIKSFDLTERRLPVKLSCHHASRDAFFGSLVFNVGVLGMLNLLILLLGLFANQRIEPIDEEDEGMEPRYTKKEKYIEPFTIAKEESYEMQPNFSDADEDTGFLSEAIKESAQGRKRVTWTD